MPVIDLAHPKPSVDAFALDDDVDGDRQQLADIVPLKLPATLRFLDQQRHLFEGKPRGVGMDRCDRARVAGIHIAYIVEGRSVSQFLQQDPIRPHAQAGFQQVLGADLRRALRALGVKQANVVRLRDDQFGRVLDRDDTLA